MENSLMEKITSLCKRRGFIFPGSEIYGGLANSWDYGPLGAQLKKNIKNSWWHFFVEQRSDMVGLDAAIIMNSKVWQASGHIDTFNDPLLDCKSCKSRFRADDFKDDYSQIDFIKETCPNCGNKTLTTPRQFNLMFKTQIGPVEDIASTVYLRPETAQGIFTNYKNVVQTMHPKLPFGIGQIGKAFRNEITPGNYTFRTLEFEQMEIEYFIEEADWKRCFSQWLNDMLLWGESIGINKKSIQVKEVEENKLAHYSKRTADIEFIFPFGQKELWGLAYRTDYDLTQHQKLSGVDLQYFDQLNNKKFIPHVIEPSFGVDRTLLALLISSYAEEKVTSAKGEVEIRVILRFPAKIAPYQAAVLPLSKKEELSSVAKKIFSDISKKIVCEYDETQSIGKRYRRQDEIGTPFCITVDFESLNDKAVTVRDRDTMKQERIKIENLINYLTDKINNED